MAHCFLANKDKGFNKKLRGNVGFCYVLVDSPKDTWDEQEEKQMNETMKRTAELFTEKAAKQGVTLSIRNFSIRTKVSRNVEYGGDKSWISESMKALRYNSVKHMWESVKTKYKLDDVVILFSFPYKGISFAFAQYYAYGEEYAVIMGRDSAETIMHEVCHLYGAADYYYTEYVKEKVKRYFGASIMVDSTTGYIDDLTAYVIGWKSELTPDAAIFLQETSHISESEWTEALKKFMTSGRKTQTFNTGTYTGEIVQGRMEGFGKFIFFNGKGAYEGWFRGGKYQGMGVLTYEDGSQYIGEFQEGKLHGKGRLLYQDGNEYIGEFRKGTFNGQGTFYYQDGQVRSGLWKEGKFVG